MEKKRFLPIMVVTFQEKFRNQATHHLHECGFNVCVPVHRTDVISVAAEHKPLVVLLDMYVNHPNGIEILRDLRGHGFTGKVVLLGGSSQSSVIAQAYQFGVHHVVGGLQYMTDWSIQLFGQIDAAIRSAFHAVVEERAYELYERRGKTHGRDLDDWLAAEQQIFNMNVRANPTVNR